MKKEFNEYLSMYTEWEVMEGLDKVDNEERNNCRLKIGGEEFVCPSEIGLKDYCQAKCSKCWKGALKSVIFKGDKDFFYVKALCDYNGKFSRGQVFKVSTESGIKWNDKEGKKYNSFDELIAKNYKYKGKLKEVTEDEFELLTIDQLLKVNKEEDVFYYICDNENGYSNKVRFIGGILVYSNSLTPLYINRDLKNKKFLKVKNIRREPLSFEKALELFLKGNDIESVIDGNGKDDTIARYIHNEEGNSERKFITIKEIKNARWYKID